MERPGEIVTREELRQRLWASDTFVDFAVALNSAVSRLRDALGDSATRPALSKQFRSAATDLWSRSPSGLP